MLLSHFHKLESCNRLHAHDGFWHYKERASDRFDGPELRSILRELERELKEGPEGGWFMGKESGRADIMLEFPMSMIKHRNRVHLRSKFPGLKAWLDRVYARDGWKRSLEEGNGYDLIVFLRSHICKVAFLLFFLT